MLKSPHLTLPVSFVTVTALRVGPTGPLVVLAELCGACEVVKVTRGSRGGTRGCRRTGLRRAMISVGRYEDVIVNTGVEWNE